MNKLEITEGFSIGGTFFKTREEAESYKAEQEAREKLLNVIAASFSLSSTALDGSRSLSLHEHERLNEAFIAASMIWKHREEIIKVLAGSIGDHTVLIQYLPAQLPPRTAEA